MLEVKVCVFKQACAPKERITKRPQNQHNGICITNITEWLLTSQDD